MWIVGEERVGWMKDIRRKRRRMMNGRAESGQVREEGEAEVGLRQRRCRRKRSRRSDRKAVYRLEKSR